MDIASLNSFRLEQVLQNPQSLGSNAFPRAQGEDFAAHLERALKTTDDKSASAKPVIDKSDQLYELCLSLETFLLKNLITGMRNTVQKSGLTDGGFAGKIYEDMLYDEYAKSFTKNANFGLAELAYLELTGQRGKVITRYSAE